MALWRCEGCTALFSVGAPCCPQCGGTDHHEEGSKDMPQAHRDRPATYEPGMVVPESDREQTEAGTVEQPPALAAREDVEREQDPTGDEARGGEARAGEGSAESEAADQQESDDDPFAGQAGPPDDYEQRTKADLASLAGSRGLSGAGNRSDLIERLREHDAKQIEG